MSMHKRAREDEVHKIKDVEPNKKQKIQEQVQAMLNQVPNDEKQEDEKSALVADLEEHSKKCNNQFFTFFNVLKCLAVDNLLIKNYVKKEKQKQAKKTHRVEK